MSTSNEFNEFMVAYALRGNIEGVAECVKKGADVNFVDPGTGLCALHCAVGTNNLELTKTLVEEFDAAFFADGHRRWPTLIAAECQVSDALGDYIVEAEARFLERNPQP